jgi:crotonobetainyl-CoA:carnitine CoA-transferase CaiB-like acyl-CoA transferase
MTSGCRLVRASGRGSAHPSITPCRPDITGDAWTFIMCNKEKFRPALCEAFGHPELANHPRVRRFPDRLKYRDLVTEPLDHVLKGKNAGVI